MNKCTKEKQIQTNRLKRPFGLRKRVEGRVVSSAYLLILPACLPNKLGLVLSILYYHCCCLHLFVKEKWTSSISSNTENHRRLSSPRFCKIGDASLLFMVNFCSCQKINTNYFIH